MRQFGDNEGPTDNAAIDYATADVIEKLRSQNPALLTAEEDFAGKVRRRIASRRRTRVGMTVVGSLAAVGCVVLSFAWLGGDLPNRPDTGAPAPHLMTNSSADTNRLPSPEAGSENHQQRSRVERWVTLQPEDVQGLASGRRGDRLRQFDGKTLAIVPVLERDGDSIELSWKARVFDPDTQRTGVMTSLDRRLLQRRAQSRPLPGKPQLVL